MNDPKIKQQIAEKIKESSNILVTVSNNPSVDELSAALGLTLLLNKMDKHATAVFSGAIPPAITFLDPAKTFEDTTNSLRDFIIALDKEKADHLRYKLEGDLVKIYITPYRTTISGDDLEFSQGDYNVELVIALGVENQDHLDAALDGHGKILHDATVVTLTAGEQTSNLGSIDWHDSNASSLSEMLTTLHEAMKLDKPLLDQSIATAFLTGIVSATERFSNPRTSSRVMTIAAQLMAAGADQQLIASKLEETQVEDVEEPQSANSSGETVLTEGSSTKLPKEKPAEPPKKKSNGELTINHEKEGTLEEVAEEVNKERLEASARAAERALEKQTEVISPVETPIVPQAQAPIEAVALPEPVLQGPVNYTPPSPQQVNDSTQTEPMLGGTLNATSEQAEEDKRREIERDKNKVILSHSYIGNQQPVYDSQLNSAVSSGQDEPSVDIFNDKSVTGALPPLEPQTAPTVQATTIMPPSTPVEVELPAPVAQPVSAPTLADIDAQNRITQSTPHDDARAAIDAAFAASSVEQAAQIPAPVVDLPMPPPLPTDFSGLPPLPPAIDPSAGILGDILAPEPQQQQNTISQSLPAPNPADPGQFKIPGQ